MDSSDSKVSWAKVNIKLSPKQLKNINEKDPFGDIKLEYMLGHGAYGRVFRALCSGEAVAVKIIEHAVPDEIEAQFYEDEKSMMASHMSGQEQADLVANFSKISGNGTTHNTPVENRNKSGVEVPSEVKVSVRLLHDNIVRTIKCGSRPIFGDGQGDI